MKVRSHAADYKQRNGYPYYFYKYLKQFINSKISRKVRWENILFSRKK